MLLRSETVEQAIEGEQRGAFHKDVVMVERVAHDGTAPLAMVRKRRLDAGPARATVLLVHGFGQNRYTWHTSRRSFANHLAWAGFDVFNVDLRGHGRSRRLGASLPYALDAYVDDLPAFVDEALALSGHAGAFFVGHSMGGLVSLAAGATTLRDKTRGIVTIGTPYRFGRGSKMLAAVTGLAMAARSTGLLDRSPRVPMRVIGRHFAKRRALWDLPFLPMPIRAWRPGAMEREMLDEYLARAFDAATLAVAIHILKGGSESALVSQDLGADWGTAFELLDRPLCVIAGTHDLLAPPDSVRPAFERSRAHDKTYREFALGHIDLVMGRDAPHTVWPLVTQWLTSRSVPA